MTAACEITGDGESPTNYVIEKRESMRQTLESIQLQQSNSLLHLALQWKDLEHYFDTITHSIAKREEEIELKIKQIDWKTKYMNKKWTDFEARKFELMEMLKMAEKRCETARRKEECCDDDLESLRCKFERFKEFERDLRRKFRKKKLKLEAKELLIDEKEHEIEFRVKKLNSVERDLLERLMEFKEREKVIELKEKEICIRNGEIKLKMKKFDENSMKLKNEGFGEGEFRVKRLNSVSERDFMQRMEGIEGKNEGFGEEGDCREDEVGLRVKKLNSADERDMMERMEGIEGKNEGFEESGDYADIRFNVVMSGKDLQKFLNGRVNDHEKLRYEVTRGISLSVDPPKLVLDAIEGFYPEGLGYEGVGFKLDVVRKSCVLLLEQLNELKARIKDRVRERAIAVAMEWKRKMNVGGDVGGVDLEVVGFLQLVATYGLVSEFCKEELLGLFESCARHDRAPELCRSLGFADHVHDIIQKLVLRNQPFDAIRLVFAFQLVHIFPPVPILRAHLKTTFNNAQKLIEDGNASTEVQIKCINMKLTVLDSVVKCIKKYGLELKYSVQNLEHQIMKLQVQKKKCNASTPDSKAKITIENKELCISVKHSSSDKDTVSSTCTTPDIPVISPNLTPKHTDLPGGLHTHHDPAMLNGPQSSSGIPPDSAIVDAQVENNPGSKRPRLASIVVAKDFEQQSLSSADPQPQWASYQYPQTPDGSSASCCYGAYVLTPYPYPLPIRPSH